MVNCCFEIVPDNNCCVALQGGEKKTVLAWIRMRREQYSICRKAPSRRRRCATRTESICQEGTGVARSLTLTPVASFVVVRQESFERDRRLPSGRGLFDNV